MKPNKKQQKKAKKQINKNAHLVKYLCEDCKLKILKETKKLKLRHMIFPKRILKKFPKLLCEDCLKKVQEQLKKEGRLK